MAEKHIKIYPNGATLIYYRQNINSTTDVTMGFISGARRDGKKKGLAHALEHSLFNGIDGMTKEEMYQIFKETGNKQNAYTTNDVITTTFNCPNASVEKIIKINGDMWAQDNYSLKEWKRERKVILQELYMALDRENTFSTKLTEAQQKHEILGSPLTLSKIEPKDFLEYKKKNFVTNNMVISVVSSLPYNQIKQYFEKYFISRFPTDARKKLKIPQYKIKLDNQEHIEDIQYSNSFLFQLVFKGVDDVEKNDLFAKFENWYFNDYSGKLYENFVLKAPLVYTPSFESIRELHNNLKCFSILTSPKNVNKCIDVMCNILSDIITNGVTDKDVEMFKKAMLAERERKTNIKCYPSDKLFNDYIYGNKPFVKDFFNKLMALSKDDINKYLKKVYGKSNFEIALQGDVFEAQNIIDAETYPTAVLSDKGKMDLLKNVEPLYTADEIKAKMRYAQYIKLENDLRQSAQNIPTMFIYDKQIREILFGNKAKIQQIHNLNNSETRKQVSKQVKTLAKQQDEDLELVA